MSDDDYDSDGGHPSWGRLGDPKKCSEDCIYKRFAANMQNAEAHDAEIRNILLDDIAQYCQKHTFPQSPSKNSLSVVALVPLINFIKSLYSEVKK